MAAYAKAKSTLFAYRGLSNSVINLDDEFGQLFFDVLKSAEVKALSFSCQNPQANLYCKRVQYLPRGMVLDVIGPQGQQAEISTKLLGGFNVSNLLAVMAAAIASGADWAQLCVAVEKLVPVKGRLETFEAQGLTVVVDYAHTPDALDKALQGVRQHCSGKLVCVFGCGGDRDRGKRPQMGAIAAAKADRVLVTSDNPRGESPQQIVDDILAGIDSSGCELDVELDRRKAIESAIAVANSGDCIVIAGKGHEDYQIINGEKLWFDDRLVAEKALQVKQLKQEGAH